MAAQKGKLFVLGIWDGISAFNDLLTARSTDMTINDETVDVTNKGSTGWRTLLEGAGVRNMSISIEGTFESSADELLLQELVVTGAHEQFQITGEDEDTFTGTFQVTSFSRSGVFNGEEVFSATLESAGVITFATV